MSRSIRDFCELWDIFKSHNTSFITLRENFDTTTAAGEMMVFNLINFAQFERKQTAERISANFKSRAQRGLWNGGNLPLGYDRDPKNLGKLFINKKEGQTVRTIFDTFLKTGNLNDTCRKLNDQGLRTKGYVNQKGETKGSNYFTVQSLHKLLTNASFIGMREINKKRGDKERVKAQWPAIIDEKLFNAVQRRLSQNFRRYKPDSWKTYSYPLTGLAICGECGQTLNGKSAYGKNAKHFYYDHPRTLRANGHGHKHACRIQRLRAGKVEDMVLGALKTILSDPKRIQHAVATYRKQTNQESPLMRSRIKTMAEEISSQQRIEQNLVNRIAELPPEISAEPIYKKLKETQDKILDIKRNQQSLESSLHKLEKTEVDSDDLQLRVQRTIAALEQAPKEKQKAIFTNVLQFAEFHPTKIRLGVFNQEQGYESSTTVKVGGEGGI